MTIDDKIRDDNLQYDINREVAKLSALLSGKIDKNEYQGRMIEQAKFYLFFFKKSLKETKKNNN